LGDLVDPAPALSLLYVQTFISALDFSDVEKTGKAVHIVVINDTKEGSTQTILERKVPLVTIKSIAMSSLRDDWIVSDYFLPKVLVDDLLFRL
jgi:hypothetical protein